MINGKDFVITEKNVYKFIESISYWIEQQVKEANRQGVVLGMSGGIDCSVVARLCQVADIPVHLVMMPYGEDMKSTDSSLHAMELIETFDFSYHIHDIKPSVDAAMIPDGSELLNGCNFGNVLLARANLRPRARMEYLYQYAQLHSLFVIGTGNLSERTVGYFTKWGDGACDLNPLAMLTKREVYLLAKYLRVPDSIINKKPSAGLWEGQTDEDELGISYTQIDEYILSGTSGDSEIDALIEKRIAMSMHKLTPIPVYTGL